MGTDTSTHVVGFNQSLSDTVTLHSQSLECIRLTYFLLPSLLSTHPLFCEYPPSSFNSTRELCRDTADHIPMGPSLAHSVMVLQPSTDTGFKRNRPTLVLDRVARKKTKREQKLRRIGNRKWLDRFQKKRQVKRICRIGS